MSLGQDLVCSFLMVGLAPALSSSTRTAAAWSAMAAYCSGL